LLIKTQLENIFLHANGVAVLGDWGFATDFTPGCCDLKDYVGSPSYCAPEMWLCQPYEGTSACSICHFLSYLLMTGPEVDIWSLGVVLYTMVVGCLPFWDPIAQAVSKTLVAQGRLQFPDDDSPSDLVRDLIASMLQTDRGKRATLAQIREHPWMLLKVPH
jgi:serine/threonine protein kinase